MSPGAFMNKVLPVKNKLFRFARRMLLNDDEAKDVVQECLIRVWEKRETMARIANIEAWCMTLTRNLCVDKLRFDKNKRKMTLQDAFWIVESKDNPYQATENNNLMELIERFINELPDKHKMAVHLRDIEGYSYREIAAIMNIDEGQVKINLFRGRKTLKERLIKSLAYGS